jgi:hypothetical protein
MRNKNHHTTKRREQILNKLEPCCCGCHGQDPWHRATYRRIVTRLSETEGTVRMPYSTQPVRITRKDFGGGLYGAWIVDRNSINFDK